MRRGGICYLDEVVEARKDVTVVLHPLTDDRRILPLDRTGETLHAPDDFMLVISYNPGYQSVLKTLKPSTRQRFVAISFDYPKPEVEASIVSRETGLDLEACRTLVRLAGRLRALKGQDLEEGASTRLLVACASLIVDGMKRDRAIEAALIEPLTDDPDVRTGLLDLVKVDSGLRRMSLVAQNPANEILGAGRGGRRVCGIKLWRTGRWKGHPFRRRRLS